MTVTEEEQVRAVRALTLRLVKEIQTDPACPLDVALMACIEAFVALNRAVTGRSSVDALDDLTLIVADIRAAEAKVTHEPLS